MRDIFEEHAPKSIADQDKFLKPDYSRVINLASNELIHPGIADLFERFFDLYSKQGDFERYPYFASTINSLAAALGISPEMCALTPGADPG